MINEKKLECTVPDSNVTFIVMSSDGYQNFWEPFIFLYKKNFPQGPKLTIFSNTIEKNIDDCQIVPLGDLAWSTRLKKALLKSKAFFRFIVFGFKSSINLHPPSCIH